MENGTPPSMYCARCTDLKGHMQPQVDRITKFKGICHFVKLGKLFNEGPVRRFCIYYLSSYIRAGC